MTKIDIQQLIDFLEESREKSSEVTLTHVMGLAEVMTGSMGEIIEHVEPEVTMELAEIGAEIARMKAEISKLRVADMRDNHIPEAGRELDAIVSSTEEATHTIMAAAEAIMAADPDDTQAYQNTVNDQVMEIFQACAFQDITGQRISKVVGTLNTIDERVSNFVERLRLKQEAHADQNAEETEDERRKRELILHGPQHAGEGVSQDEIDALLNDVKQDEIDKLFA
ncbi:chemotaxis regulator CheZ [Pseudovibrio axinellae]|uniref:Chemotaxis regulator CheZ n=1 Tax=Pseudovibrio axinellae TaxID=989403 RepID=A0A165YCM0_9HYPH|nr:protein phosphatase CheZ [Pseudovibrio axinellae]KZL18719.1 chemotaxis regulator CheZ [Pseudovibrio axinellae]SEP95405.1 chemotaxis protein CheZ [Pseudovibrio axinellae]